MIGSDHGLSGVHVEGLLPFAFLFFQVLFFEQVLFFHELLVGDVGVWEKVVVRIYFGSEVSDFLFEHFVFLFEVIVFLCEVSEFVLALHNALHEAVDRRPVFVQ